MVLTNHFLNIPAIYRLGTHWIGYVPTFLSYTISQGIADISYVLYKSAVKNVKQNLKLIFPNLAEKEISRITKRLFRNYSKYLVNYGRFTNLDKKNVLSKITFFDGRENLDSTLKMNKGLILLTAHLGNWELGGIFFGSYGVRTNVVTIQDRDSKIDNARRWYREKHNVSTITIGNSPFSTLEMVKALKNGEIVAMLIDRYNSSLENSTVDFFHKPVMFPRGPFILSRLTGAPIIVAFVVKEGKGYRGIVNNPINVTSEKEEEEALKTVVKILESYIIMYPDQWYNFTPI
ncbi:MAG: lysophospholipid acyltransferase family protein [Nitrospirae bacterium]|nr:lysophospholipid acyltransferase family protein [Nitrospirota bacterium]